MPSKFWPTYNKAIRDAIITVINTRKGADAITVAEGPIAGLHRDPKRYAANGIYVMPGSWTPEAPNKQSSFDVVGTFRYQVVCNVRAWLEATQMDKVGELSGLVVDAIDANRTLGGQLGVIHAYISSVGEPQPGLGGPDEFAVLQSVEITVEVSRVEAT